MVITMDVIDLTQEEISFIKTRHATKQLAFALLFKCYQVSHQFIDDLTKVPRHITNKLAHLINVPPIISKISLRTYGNYISLIRKYFKTSFSKKAHYKELEGWIKNKILPTNHITEEEIEALAIHYLKERGIESFKEKTMTLKNSLSPEDEAQLNGLLLPYKDGLSYLGWINKEINNPSLDSMLVLMEQLSILNRFNFDLATIRLIPRKRILHYSDAFTRLNPSDLKQMTDNNRCAHLRIHSHIRKEQLTDKIIDVFNRIIRNVIHKSEKRVVKKLRVLFF